MVVGFKYLNTSTWIVATPMHVAFIDTYTFVFKVVKTNVFTCSIDKASDLIINDFFQSCLCVIVICLKDVFKHKVDHIVNSTIAVFN